MGGGGEGDGGVGGGGEGDGEGGDGGGGEGDAKRYASGTLETETLILCTEYTVTSANLYPPNEIMWNCARRSTTCSAQ